MLRLILILCFLAVSATSNPLYASQTGKAILSVVFKNLQVERGGILRAALVNDKKHFAKTGDNQTIYRDATYDVKTDTVTIQFHNIDKGDYAVQAFQDSNKNGELDMGFFGPTERYGFSNDATGFLSAPSYEDAVITVDEEWNGIVIHLH